MTILFIWLILCAVVAAIGSTSMFFDRRPRLGWLFLACSLICLAGPVAIVVEAVR